MIVVRDIHKSFKKTKVLRGLSFEARPGEVTAFLGPNGAGKTTTIRILATLLRPESGSVEICGHDTQKDSLNARRMLGVLTEEVGLALRLTVREQLTMSGLLYGLSRVNVDARIDELAGMFDLGDHIQKRGGALSKGTRQKVALARAIIHDPQVVLLDEPTANLDVLSATKLLELVSSRAVLGNRTVLLCTHRLEEVEALAQRVVGISHGREVVSGTLSEVTAIGGQATFGESFVSILGRAELDEVA